MFSIVIPAYNPGAYFSEAIESVLAQSFADWELIVVDDGSRPEEAAAIAATLDEARRKVPNEIHLVAQKNGGLSIARNVGIARASRPWIAFLDADDAWRPNILQTHCDAIQARPEAALSFTGFELIDGEGQSLGPGWGRPMTYLSMLSGRFTTLPTACAVKREVLAQIGTFDTTLLAAQDIDLFLRILQRHSAAYSPALEVLYRQHESNMSRRFMVTWRECEHILQKHLLWGRAKKRRDVIEAAERGLRRIKGNWGGQAFDAARASAQEKKLDTLLYIALALRLSPRQTLSQMKKFLSKS